MLLSIGAGLILLTMTHLVLFQKNGNDHAVYAICKRAACDILEHCQIADGFEPCVFRHFMVYGWHPDAWYYLDGEKKCYHGVI